MDVNKNNTQANTDQEINKEETTVKATDNIEGAKLYKEASDWVDNLGLDFTFRSIDWVLRRKKTSFAQLRSCVYIVDGEAYFDYVQSVSLIVQAGLIGSKQVKAEDMEALEDKAYEIIDDFRTSIGFIGLLHIILINILEGLHFFIGKTDVQMIEHLSYKNLQKELAVNMLREDLEEKMRQAQALSV